MFITLKAVAKLNLGRRNKLEIELEKNSRHSLSDKKAQNWSFHVVALQRMTKKCTKIYNARAQLLFCSLNLLFGDVLVAFVVVVCLNSLLSFVTTLFCVYCDKKA